MGLYYIVVNNICDLKLKLWYQIDASNLCISTDIMTHGWASKLHGRGGRGKDVSRQQLQDEHDGDTTRYSQQSIHRLFNTPPYIKRHGSVPPLPILHLIMCLIV